MVDDPDEVIEPLGGPTHLQPSGMAPGQYGLQAGLVQGQGETIPEGRIVEVQVAGLQADPIHAEFGSAVEEVPGGPARARILLTLPYLAEEAMVRVGVDPDPHRPGYDTPETLASPPVRMLS